MNAIEAPNSDVRLFASHSTEMGSFDVGSDGPIVNLPLVAALVHDGKRWIVFDGNFLNAARDPRRGEVTSVLDAAIVEGSVLYGTSPVDFTSGMSPSDAAAYLASIPTKELTNKSRIDYARLLTRTNPAQL